jgi:hypothetical protein
MENQKFIVYVDDNFHYMDEDYRGKHGEYEKYEEAVKVCKTLVDLDVADLYEQNKNRGEILSADQLYCHYTTFGEDPWITPEPEGKHFSAWEYAKAKAKELTK